MPDDRGRRKRSLDPAADAELARRLREERLSQGLSVRELARRLELSASAVSQIETGRARPSVSTLYGIVSELGLSLDALFPVPPGTENTKTVAAPADAEAGIVQRQDSRKTLDLESGVRWERLTPRPDSDLDFLYVTYDVGGASSHETLMRHSGREHGLVLSGKLEVTVGFEVFELEAGDSVSFDSAEPHRLRNVGDEPAHGIWVVLGRGGDDRRTSTLQDGNGAS